MRREKKQDTRRFIMPLCSLWTDFSKFLSPSDSHACSNGWNVYNSGNECNELHVLYSVEVWTRMNGGIGQQDVDWI